MDPRHESAKSVEGAGGHATVQSLGMQPWWRGGGAGFGPVALQETTTATSSSSDAPGKPMNDGGNTTEENQQTENVKIGMPSLTTEHLLPNPLLEIGQSVAPVAYPYSDPYFAAIMTPYGSHSMAHYQLPGLPQAHQVPLPLETSEEPVYVNAKQYHGILRRRESRARAEIEKKVTKARKPYLHESRHQHALRRARGSGGRFLKKTENSESSSEKNPKSAVTVLPTPSVSSSEAPYSNSSGDQPRATGNGTNEFEVSSFRPEATNTAAFLGKQRKGIAVNP